MTTGYSLTRRRAMRDLAVAISGAVIECALPAGAEQKQDQPYPKSCEERAKVHPRYVTGWRTGCESPNLRLPKYLGNGQVSNHEQPIFGDSGDSRLVLLAFFYTSCIPCWKEVPSLNTIHERYAPRGLQVSAINTDAYWQADNPANRHLGEGSKTPGFFPAWFFKKAGVEPKYDVFLDTPDPTPTSTKAEKAFDITSSPTTFLLAVDSSHNNAEVINDTDPTSLLELDIAVQDAFRQIGRKQ